jgi:hypothetical protein
VGVPEGIPDGTRETLGTDVGFLVGLDVGELLGIPVGDDVGIAVGLVVVDSFTTSTTQN